MNEWYANLNRPPLTPPSRVFGPVWTVLYVTIACSIFLYYRSPAKTRPGLTTVILVVHLISNLVWTSLFFGLRSPALALMDILVLDVTLVFLMIWFWKASTLSGALLVPYLAWVLFATYLNYGFYRLNS